MTLTYAHFHDTWDSFNADNVIITTVKDDDFLIHIMINNLIEPDVVKEQ